MQEKIDAKKLYDTGTSYQFETPEILLGPWTSYSMKTDPKHLCFVLSRYKFCAKLLERPEKLDVLEVGCGDGIGLPILASAARNVYAADWDKRLLMDNQERMNFLKNVQYKEVDFNVETCDDLGNIDAVVLIDVIEHLAPDSESEFMDHVIHCITDKQTGFMIIGTPNITASEYASPQSKVQHCNLKSMESLRSLMAERFYNVFMFGQNDEVVHTGYAPMCHYIWALGVGVK